MEEKIWVYIGKGSYLDGIPARDLTEADWARLNEDERAAVANSKLYRRAPRPAAPAPTESKAEQEPAKEPTREDAKSAKSARDAKE